MRARWAYGVVAAAALIGIGFGAGAAAARDQGERLVPGAETVLGIVVPALVIGAALAAGALRWRRRRDPHTAGVIGSGVVAGAVLLAMWPGGGEGRYRSSCGPAGRGAVYVWDVGGDAHREIEVWAGRCDAMVLHRVGRREVAAEPGVRWRDEHTAIVDGWAVFVP